ncbi:MAG: ATP-binding protein [Deltaproteobacteria bacterium]
MLLPGATPAPVMMRALLLDGSYSLTLMRGLQEDLEVGGKSVRNGARALNEGTKVLNPRSPDGGVEDPAVRFGRELRPAHLLRLDPDAMRAPSGLVLESDVGSFLDERGTGLAGAYYAILSRGDESFGAIVKQLRELFPSVKTLRVPPVSATQVTLQVELIDGTKVPAQHVSEGMLYFLAFAALRFLANPSVLLVEEPENGLHPSRIADVMRILRDMASAEPGATQVLIATYSPLVINEMRPEEVTVVTRSPGEGSKFTPIVDTPNFSQRSQVYALGELWLSYANGTDEQPLLNPAAGGAAPSRTCPGAKTSALGERTAVVDPGA